jgi:hypothetical protein
MCTQLGLEVICKRSKKKGIPSNFCEFGSVFGSEFGSIHCKNYPKIKDFDV